MTMSSDKKQKKDAINKIIGDNLKLIRMSRGLTQGDMAIFYNCNQSHFSKLERGETNFCVKDLWDFCEKLNLDPMKILTKNNPF